VHKVWDMHLEHLGTLDAQFPGFNWGLSQISNNHQQFQGEWKAFKDAGAMDKRKDHFTYNAQRDGGQGATVYVLDSGFLSDGTVRSRRHLAVLFSC